MIARKNTPIENAAHYIVEGQRFRSLAELCRAARERGFDGDETAMSSRMRRGGPLTWAHLASPVNVKQSTKRREVHQRSVDEGLAAARAVDERRARILAAQAALETEEG